MIINTNKFNLLKIEERNRSFVLYLQNKITKEKILAYIEKEVSN